MNARYKCSGYLPKSTIFWHCLTILFVICLLINGIIYFGGTGNYKYPSSIPPPLSKLLKIVQSNPVKSTLPPTNATKLPINPHNYKYILNEPDKCTNLTSVIIIVCTSVKNFAERQAIRETWGSVARSPNSTVSLLFLIGSGVSTSTQNNVFNESRIHHDIIQEDFKDSYRNLSIKSQALLKWVSTYCMTAKYVLKADDDMYVNVPNLLKSLASQKDEKFILGVTFIGAKPVQSIQSKWYTPLEDFNEKYYPKYTSGTSYSMSVAAVPDLYKATLETKLFWLEDIYITGICARKAGIKRINDYGFHYVKMKPEGCAHKNSVTGHRNTVQEIRKIHNELNDPKLKCS